MNAGRFFLFDNVKAAMLVLVAFGHVLHVYMHNGVAEYTLMKYIYLFHMPVFAFVTGYFSKDADKARATAMTRALFPYLLFQGLYILMASAMIAMGLATFKADVFAASMLLPSSAFYYLLVVFFWKLFLKDIRRFRWPLVLSVFLGCAVSLTNCKPFHYGLGAVFGFLPFFVLGAQTGEGTIRQEDSPLDLGDGDVGGSAHRPFHALRDPQCADDVCGMRFLPSRWNRIQALVLRSRCSDGRGNRRAGAGRAHEGVRHRRGGDSGIRGVDVPLSPPLHFVRGKVGPGLFKDA